jgi:hypothetical protein
VVSEDDVAARTLLDRLSGNREEMVTGEFRCRTKTGEPSISSSAAPTGWTIPTSTVSSSTCAASPSAIGCRRAARCQGPRRIRQ